MINKLKKRFQAITNAFEIEPQELEIKKKDGNIALIKTAISYFKIGEKKFFQAIIQDITEQKQAEQKLKESEEKFRNISDQSLIGIGIVQENRVKYVNKKFADIFGYTVEEMLNWSPEEFMITVHPDDREFVFDQVKKKQAGSEDYLENYQFRGITKSGEIIWIENYTKTIMYEGKTADFVVFIDITERKNAQQELHKLNQLKSELLRRTSHELKTPLVSIKGFSELLLEVHRDKLDALVISTLNEIKQGCLRLENLIGDILKTAELESGTIQPSKLEEDLSFLVRLCVNEIKGFSTLRNHAINVELHDSLITHFEKEQIHQVISNLLNNAIKYTPPGGSIKIKSDIREDLIIISIKDNGIGFTEEEKTRIFKQFGKIERYGQGLDIVAEGSGFGLFISKKIIELHGGDIWVESEGRNKGSTFFISLPLL
jgi:PAS domain S-box-containing protein